MPASQGLLARPEIGPALAWTLAPLLAPDAVASGYAEAFSPHAVDPATVARGQLLYTRPGTLLASARDWAALEGTFAALGARFKEIAIPVEAISANQDQIVGPVHAAYLEAHVPGIHVTRLDGAGHQLMFSEPDDVVAAIERALARAGR